MKKNRTRSKYRHNYLLTGIAGLVLSSSHSSFDETSALKWQKKQVEKKHFIKESPDNERKNLLKVVHNPETGTIKVTVKDIANKTVDFYVFDLEGTMVINCKLKSKEKKLIDSLEKGEYTYNAFAGDEEIDFGKIIID